MIKKFIVCLILGTSFSYACDYSEVNPTNAQGANFLLRLERANQYVAPFEDPLSSSYSEKRNASFKTLIKMQECLKEINPSLFFNDYLKNVSRNIALQNSGDLEFFDWCLELIQFYINKAHGKI